ncbi:hypothetical protein AX15_003803 [Amanita polypyramis BW_CC]|nr:hypothetical protein AX15_003803 [Amanita polypyramis BW_CC]
MAHNIHLLNNMNLNPETLELAKSILRETTVRTKPGSGFELGPHTTGLPAICAYIASKRLKTNDLTRGTAQVASCLKNTDFEKAFHIVEAAIGGSRRTGSKVTSYQSMCLNYQASEQHLSPFFQQAERALLLINARYNPERTPEVRYGIFFWVLSLWKREKISREKFSDENNLYYKGFASILAVLNDKCRTLKEEIVEKAMNQTSSPSKAMPTPTRRSPLKRPLRELPSRDSPQKKRLISPEPARQPTQDPSIRILLSELESRPFPETPTKKRKLEDLSVGMHQRPAVSTPLKSILRTSPRKGSTTSTPCRVKLDVARFETNALSDSDSEMDTGPLPALNLTRGQSPSSDGSASDIDADPAGELEADESMMEDAESFLSSPNKHRVSSKVGTTSIRRFRPVYPDYKQWNTLDPHLQSIYTRP